MTDDLQVLGQRKQESYQGDFVLDSMKKPGDKKFSNVADFWLENGCVSFDDARAKLVEDQQQIEDIHGPLSEWNVFATDSGIVFRNLVTYREYVPTDHALNLMCNVGRGMSTWAVRSLREPIGHPTKKDEDGNPIPIKGGERSQADYELLRDYIRVHLFNAERVDQDKTRLFRTWSNGTLRALLSDKYSIVNNVWFLGVLEKAIPGGLVSHWNGDADSLYGNILIPDTIRQEEDSDFGGMLSVGNSEIGTRRVSSLPSVFRAICMNGCIWDQEKGQGINKVHRGTIDFDQLEKMIVENLEKQIPLLPQGIERLLGLRAFGCGETPMPNILAQVAIDHQMSKKETSEVFKGWSTEMALLGPKEGKTAYGLANGITRAGQEFNNDRWVKFDTIGGDFANMSRDSWDKFRNRADNLSEKQVEKRIGALV